MSALANHAFVKMNGLGNEIVVVDMRGQPGAIGAAEARAAAQPNGAPYDQLITLHAPRTPGTDGYLRIYNDDGSEAGACGNGMRCVAELLFKETGKSALTLETTAGLLGCWKDDRPLVSTVDMGKPRFAWNEIPLAEKFDDTRAIALQIGPTAEPILHSPSVVSMGNPHAIFWVVPVGRPLNAYEAEVIRRQAQAAGGADAVVGNTCAVTAEAVRQSREAIRKLKREYPDAPIVVTGCAAQTEPKTFAHMPEVALVLGNEEKISAQAWRQHRDVLARASFGVAAEEKIAVNDIMAVRETAAQLIHRLQGRSRAFLQVQNGCDHRWTLCILTFGRGESGAVRNSQT